MKLFHVGHENHVVKRNDKNGLGVARSAAECFNEMSLELLKKTSGWLCAVAEKRDTYRDIEVQLINLHK